MSGTSFNTASGMDCMQLSSILPFQNEDAGTVSIPQAVWIACNFDAKIVFVSKEVGFNTASGMDCMQCRA